MPPKDGKMVIVKGRMMFVDKRVADAVSKTTNTKSKSSGGTRIPWGIPIIDELRDKGIISKDDNKE